MVLPLRSYRPEQLAGLAFVLALHGVLLYGLWSYRLLPVPEAVVMIGLVNPSPPEPQAPTNAESPKPVPPRPVVQQEPQQLVAAVPEVKPDEPLAPSPSPPPVVEAPPAPPQPVVLGGELAVSCIERSPPEYPASSRRRNEQGRVVLRVELAEDGRIDGAAVRSSSGSSRLDQAALNAVKAWRCRPVVRNGVAVRAVALQPFNFSLVEN